MKDERQQELRKQIMLATNKAIHGNLPKQTRITTFQVSEAQGAVIEAMLPIIAQHDQTLKQKLLAALPEKKIVPNEGKLDRAGWAVHDKAIAHNQVLSDITKTIEEVYGE